MIENTQSYLIYILWINQYIESYLVNEYLSNSLGVG